MVFEQAGEETDGGLHRCEGDKGCDRWIAQKGDTYEQKLKACEDCPKKCSPPAQNEITEAADAEVDRLVEQVRYLVSWEDAGIATDWSEYPFYIQRLFVMWRTAERDLKRRDEYLQRQILRQKLQQAPGA